MRAEQAGAFGRISKSFEGRSLRSMEKPAQHNTPCLIRLGVEVGLAKGRAAGLPLELGHRAVAMTNFGLGCKDFGHILAVGSRWAFDSIGGRM